MAALSMEGNLQLLLHVLLRHGGFQNTCYIPPKCRVRSTVTLATATKEFNLSLTFLTLFAELHALKLALLFELVLVALDSTCDPELCARANPSAICCRFLARRADSPAAHLL